MAAYTSKYSWKPGYSYKVSAQTVGEALETIESQEGAVSSRAFLDYSRPEEAETHGLFEWDDSIAAEKYRMHQAGCIINQLSVQIVYEDSKPEEVHAEIRQEEYRPDVATPITAYVNVSPKTVKGAAEFRNITAAMENEDTRRQVLMNALQELRAFEKKYQMYKEFAKVFAAIEEAEEEIR